jgi:hypothetical protein
MDFDVRDTCKGVLLKLSFARNLEKNSYVPLWEQMEAGRLPPQSTLVLPLSIKNRYSYQQSKHD